MNHLGTRTQNNEMALCDAWCPVAFPKCPWANWSHQNPLEKLNGFVYWNRWRLKESEAIREDSRSPDFIDFSSLLWIFSWWVTLETQTGIEAPNWISGALIPQESLVNSKGPSVPLAKLCQSRIPPDRSDGRRAQWFSEAQRLFRRLVSGFAGGCETFSCWVCGNLF